MYVSFSPVLGFLGIGALLGPAGLSVMKDLSELDTLGELGISFLLFEQGLELSLDRLKALSKYAFGLGTLQVQQYLYMRTLYLLEGLVPCWRALYLLEGLIPFGGAVPLWGGGG